MFRRAWQFLSVASPNDVLQTKDKKRTQNNTYTTTQKLTNSFCKNKYSPYFLLMWIVNQTFFYQLGRVDDGQNEHSFLNIFCPLPRADHESEKLKGA